MRAPRRTFTGMRAAINERFGGPEVLEVRDIVEPHAGPGQLRVRVSAAGLNPLVAGVFQSAAAAGPKNSRNHRSVSQAGRDHNARLLITRPF